MRGSRGSLGESPEGDEQRKGLSLEGEGRKDN